MAFLFVLSALTVALIAVSTVILFALDRLGLVDMSEPDQPGPGCTCRGCAALPERAID